MTVYQRLLPYGVAIASTATALLLNLWLGEIMSRSIGSFFYIAVTITACWGGMRPAIVAIVLSALALNYFFMPPLHHLHLIGNDGWRLLVFTLVSAIITLLSSHLRQTRKQLEQLNQRLNHESADRLRVALHSAQMGMWDWDMITGEIVWSPEHEQLFGLAPGSFDGRYETFHARLHPSDRAELDQAITAAVKNGVPYRHEFRIVWADGSIHWIEGRGQAFYNNDGQPVRMSGTVMAIDDRKHAQLLLQQQFEQQRLVIEMTNRIRESLNLQEILQTTVDEVRHFLHVDRVVIFEFSTAWGGRVSVESVGDAALAISPFDIYDPCIGQTYVEPFQQGLVTAKADIYTADISPCHVEFLAQFQIRANLVVPILKNNELWGLLAAHHCTAPRPWQDTEIDLLRQLASQLSIALQQSDLLEQVQAELRERQQAELALQELNTGLEQRVEDRTTELAALNDRLLTALKDQAQTQAALQESEERRRLALDLTHIGFWDLHIPTGKIIWNDNHFTLLGLQPGEQEASYKLWEKHLHPEDLGWVQQRYTRCIEERTDYTAEYRVIHPDGSVHWLMARARGIYTETGEALRSIGVLLDITDRKNVETLLQQQTRQKQLLWSITQNIRQSLDLETILNAAVTHVRQLLNVDRVAIYHFDADWSGDFIAESVAEGWVKLVEPGISKVWEDTYLQETQGGRFQNHETLAVADIHTADLQPCHIDLLQQFQARAYAIAPIFVGESLWGLFALYQNAAPHDWTAWEIDLLQQIASQLAIAIQQSALYHQLQIELYERRQSAAGLRESERRWRSLLENVQLIVVGLDHAGVINYVNPFFLSLTGYTEPEVIGKEWFETFLLPGRQQTTQIVFSEVVNQNAHPYYQDIILTKTGEERYIAWNNTQLQDFDGSVIGTISIGEDITERQKVEKIKNEFISIVSHELRTPLTAIQMSLGLLKLGVYANKPEKAQRMIEIALTDTKRLVNLVNDILDLERLESGRIVLEKTPCQAADLLQQAVNGVQAIASQHQITFTLASTDVTVWAAADAIIQTLTNLLSNAIKFSPTYSTVVLQAERQANQVLFQVRDQGRGIPADKLETIFGRFQQIDSSDSREKGGTGLGLSICRSIIERHGGKIWAESTLGEGSTFFFTLPLVEAVTS
ncbi:MAG: PAS domain-containing protein [Leptolyngbyaceae cyanobacterium bins.349]|nr:PAS domain-containing protein [Leptolyngbyaceae cyanobacterium bins.349]